MSRLLLIQLSKKLLGDKLFKDGIDNRKGSSATHACGFCLCTDKQVRNFLRKWDLSITYEEMCQWALDKKNGQNGIPLGDFNPRTDRGYSVIRTS